MHGSPETFPRHGAVNRSLRAVAEHRVLQLCDAHQHRRCRLGIAWPGVLIDPAAVAILTAELLAPQPTDHPHPANRKAAEHYRAATTATARAGAGVTMTHQTGRVRCAPERPRHQRCLPPARCPAAGLIEAEPV